MLRDLEARQDPISNATAKPVYQDLRPVRSGAGVSFMRAAVVVIIVLALAVGAYFGFEKVMGPQFSLPAIAVKSPSAVSPAVNAPIQEVVAPATPPPTTSSSMPEQPKPEEPKISVAPVVQPPVVAAVTTPPPAVAEPKPAPPPAAAPRPSSPPSTGTGIVKRGESLSTATRARTAAEVKAPKAKTDSDTASNTETGIVLDKKVRPLTAEENAEASYRRALRLIEQGRSEEAIHQLREALAAQPTHVKARELAAGIELQTGHWREAQGLLEEGLRHVSNNYLFARMLARVYVDHGAEGKALAVMESAAPQGSDDGEFSALLGLLYQRAGRHADAIKAYERAVSLQPNEARTWLGFAISLEGIEQWGAAKNAYRRAQQGDLPPSLARYAEQRLAALKDQ